LEGLGNGRITIGFEILKTINENNKIANIVLCFVSNKVGKNINEIKKTSMICIAKSDEK
jgi:hypothetical protein